MNNKADGAIAELRVALRAFEEGVIVSQPMGDNEQYDFVMGRQALHRVQVKSTARLVRSAKSGYYQITAGYGTAKARYTKDHIDFLVCCVGWNDNDIRRYAYYIIPIEKIRVSQGIQLYPHRDNPLGHYERYKDAWELLT